MDEVELFDVPSSFYEQDPTPVPKSAHDCGAYVLAYSERWDSGYCASCRQWLEPPCACPPEEGCCYSGRPREVTPREA